MENGDKIKIHERLSKLETTSGDIIKTHERLRRLEVLADQIIENHLPHLQKSVDGLNAKFWAIILLLIASLVELLMALPK